MNYSDKDLLNLYSNPEFYDQEFSKRDFEIPFYRKWHKEIAGKTLEVACGTGRITLELAKVSDRIIYGTDLSPDMIQRARDKAKALNLNNVEFKVEDFRDTTGIYDLIICATNAFQHLLTSEDAFKFLKSCNSSLSSNGYLVFDIQNPDLKKLSGNLEMSHKYKEFIVNGELIEAYITGRYDSIFQIYYFNIIYFTKGIEIYKKSVAMRMFFPQEIQFLIGRAGFTILKTFGSFEEDNLDSNSNRQLYICAKNN